jgi:putative cofactor-binding repeat protein
MTLLGGALTLRNSQVTGNSAPRGGGIFNNAGTVTLSNTAVTGNVVDNCEPLNSIAGCTG